MTDDIFVFTIQSLTRLIGLVCVIRFLLSSNRSSLFGPTYMLIARLTDWLVRPMNRIFPRIGGYETAPAFAAWAFYSIEYFLVWNIRGVELTAQPLLGAMLVLGMAQVFKIIIYIFIAVILIHVIFSWVNPSAPMAYLFRSFADRILSPFRRIVPMAGPFDLTPIAAIFLAQIALIVINNLERQLTLML